MSKPSVSFHTLGCRLNQAETATMEQLLEQEGFLVVDFKESADVVVVNTCTVTGKGDADTRRLVNRIVRRLPNVRIALVGCQAQLQADALAQLPNVRWVIGTARKMDLPALLRNDEGEPLIVLDEIRRESFRMPAAGIDRKHTRANLKVQDGCDFFCSYCEVPYARGRARSREFGDVLAEARTLVDAGHRELVLTGINVGCYGYEENGFIDVVRGVLAIEGLGRLRVSSIEPTTIAEELLGLMRDEPRLCRHLHIPMQSGCDATLRRMRRRYSVAELGDFIRLAHDTVPDINLGTDVMVGFPGETDEEFETTVATIESLPFAYLHVFSYSERPNARSKDLDVPTVAPDVIAQRSKRLHELENQKRNAFLCRFVGTTLPVLVEQKKQDRWSGLTDNFIRVHFPANGDLTNQIVNVRIDQVETQSVVGSLA